MKRPKTSRSIQSKLMVPCHSKMRYSLHIALCKTLSRLQSVCDACQQQAHLHTCARGVLLCACINSACYVHLATMRGQKGEKHHLRNYKQNSSQAQFWVAKHRPGAFRRNAFILTFLLIRKARRPKALWLLLQAVVLPGAGGQSQGQAGPRRGQEG